MNNTHIKFNNVHNCSKNSEGLYCISSAFDIPDDQTGGGYAIGFHFDGNSLSLEIESESPKGKNIKIDINNEQIEELATYLEDAARFLRLKDAVSNTNGKLIPNDHIWSI